MKWYEYKQEAEELHAPDELKARLLAMAPDPAQPVRPAKKRPALRFPRWRRWAPAAACAALAVVGVSVLGTGIFAASIGYGGGAGSMAVARGSAGDYSAASLDAYSLESANSLAAESAGSAARQAAGEKIIYTADLTLETKDYDAARAALEQALAEAGGYMESSSESNYTGSARSLYLTLRVPEENYASFLAAAGETASLVSKSEQAEDVTAQYMDVAARLENLESQRARLLELQASAETLADLLDIESKLSDVQYQLESWQSQLDWYDDQVGSCTVTVSLSEVESYTPTGSSFAERLAAAFGEGWQNFVGALAAVAVALAGLWPVVVLAAAVAVVLVLRRRRR